MEKAKAAVSSFVARSGHHTTTVDETVVAPITEEQVQRTRHEEVQQAIDREVHQDHYHTTVQPIAHREILPEKHTHQIAAVQERSFDHDNKDETRIKLEQEAAKFKDTTTHLETRHTMGAAPTVEGEHVHHHVYETVQPIIHKETIVPEVIHTTVPIHELHHATVQHHGTSVLPIKTLEDFKAAGGALVGGKKTHGEYDGCPRPYNTEMQLDHTKADDNPHSPIGSGLAKNTSIASAV